MSYISAVCKDNTVVVWERTKDGERVSLNFPAPFYFYYDDPNGKYTTIYDTKVSKQECSSYKEFTALKRKHIASGLQVWESDIPPELRLLSNRYYNVPAPKLNISLLDIEVDYDPERGLTVQEMVAHDPYAPINSVAICHHWKKQVVVLTVPPEGTTWTSESLEQAIKVAAPDAPILEELDVNIIVCKSEQELLLTLLLEIQDSDVLSGWNSDWFDLPYIAQRIVRVLDKETISLRTREDFNPTTGKPTLVYEQDPNERIQKSGRFKWLKMLDFPEHGMPAFEAVANKINGRLLGNTLTLVGRVHVDYMSLVKKYEPGEKPSYKLEAISEDVLVDEETKAPTLPKLTYEGTLRDLYRNNFPFFVRYNIRDTEILYGFEQKLGYIDVANLNYHLSTGLFGHVTGTLKLAELALINYCHHELKRVVNNVREPEIDRSIDGALVLLPQKGLHEWVGSIDINSLYPNSIRSLNISPEMIRGQFEECVTAAEAIARGSDDVLTLMMEGDPHPHKHPASKWRKWLLERKYAVSGYGTVFSQEREGFIPGLLADWYTQRKRYQALKKKAEVNAEDVLSRARKRIEHDQPR